MSASAKYIAFCPGGRNSSAIHAAISSLIQLSVSPLPMCSGSFMVLEAMLVYVPEFQLFASGSPMHTHIVIPVAFLVFVWFYFLVPSRLMQGG